jgi:uncharacterized protein HemX
MARNRKNQAGVRFGPAIAAFALCMAIGGAGLGYVWQKDQIHDLGQRIRKLEQELEKARRDNKQAADHLAFLASPRNLENRVRELNLGLVQPEPRQILRLWDAPYLTVPDGGERRTVLLDDSLAD